MNDMLFVAPEIDHRLTLEDGSIYRIRPIGRDDRHLLEAGFARLSPQSRRLRFFNVKQVLTERELDFFSSPDGRNHIALGAVRLDAQGNEVEGVGSARCIRLEPDSDTAELAVTVVDDMQGRGLGGTLLMRLVRAARRQGIRRFHCEVLAENQAMRALAAGLGSEPRWLGDGILEYDCPLPESSPRAEFPWLSDPFALGDENLEVALAEVDRGMNAVIDLYEWLLRSWLNQLARAT